MLVTAPALDVFAVSAGLKQRGFPHGRVLDPEGLHFAKKSGLDVAAVVDTIAKGAAQSWQMDNRYKAMNEGKFDFGFAVEWMRKDLSICIAEARRNGANLPVTALVDQFYAEVEKMGGKRWDTSSLMARLER